MSPHLSKQRKAIPLALSKTSAGMRILCTSGARGLQPLRSVSGETHTRARTEFFLNIFCGCAPTLKPLYDLWFKGKPIRPSDASGQGASYRVRGMFGSSFGGSNNRSFNFRLLSRNNHSDHLGSDHDNRAWPVPPVDSSIKVEQRVDIDSVPKNYTMPAAANRDMV